MLRPSRMFYFRLAEKLGKTVKELLESMDSREISEWAAYERTQDDEWREEHRQKQMTDEERSAAILKMFGG